MRASIEPTGCCAIGLFHASNTTPLEEILSLVEGARKEVEERNWKIDQGERGWGGVTSLLCVSVMPFELPLSQNLVKAGFFPTFTTARRKGYPKGWELVHVLVLKDPETF